MIKQTTVHISLPIYNVKEQKALFRARQLPAGLGSSVPSVRRAVRCAPSVWAGYRGGFQTCKHLFSVFCKKAAIGDKGVIFFLIMSYESFIET